MYFSFIRGFLILFTSVIGYAVEDSSHSSLNSDPADSLSLLGLGDEAVGELGKGFYLAVAATMQVKHAGSPIHRLNRQQVSFLVPILGDWVTGAEIIYNARLMDEIGSYLGKTFKLNDAEAQTYGYRIYIDGGEANSMEQLALVLHELVHVRQYRHYGEDLSRFGYHYFKGWAQSGYHYRKIPLEKEAYELEERFQQLVDAYRGCLGRDPDAQGFGHYWKKLEKGWSLEEIKSDLNFSFEARYQKGIPISSYGDVLLASQSLGLGKSLRSYNGKYTLSLEKNGDLCLFEGSKLVWHTDTADRAVQELIMQKNGNLELVGTIFRGHGQPIRQVIWETQTSGNSAYLVIQNDRNLVVYRNSKSQPFLSQSDPVWRSNTGI